MVDQPSKEIPLPYILTPQEQFFFGGSPGEVTEPYMPVGIFGFFWDPDSRFPLRDIIRERERLGNFQSQIAGSALGLNGPAVISLPLLDSSGRTTEDPKILGSWDAEKEGIVTYNRDLTKEFIEKSRAAGTEIPMRGLGGETEPPRDISRK